MAKDTGKILRQNLLIDGNTTEWSTIQGVIWAIMSDLTCPITSSCKSDSFGITIAKLSCKDMWAVKN